MGRRFRPMPRVPRHQSAPGTMCPGPLYHVTSHAVAGTWLFETARDRVMFLAFLAWQCRERGLVVHAFCCMGNHWHGILEDRRGQLSQAMSLVKSMFTRYYNATRHGGRRNGALWAERFSAEVIDSRRLRRRGGLRAPQSDEGQGGDGRVTGDLSVVELRDDGRRGRDAGGVLRSHSRQGRRNRRDPRLDAEGAKPGKRVEPAATARDPRRGAGVRGRRRAWRAITPRVPRVPAGEGERRCDRVSRGGRRVAGETGGEQRGFGG